jgi:L-lactate dehydrogenase complex protein LldF
MEQLITESGGVDANTRAFLSQARASKFHFDSISAEAAVSERLRFATNTAIVRQDQGWRVRLLDLPDSDRLRQLAGDIKQHTLDHLDYYLEQLIASVKRNGGHVHFAADSAEARKIILDLVVKSNCKRCIKSKSAVSEEIDLTHALELAGLELVDGAEPGARNQLRSSDFGMTSGNFVVAESGVVCVVENERSARQSITTPRVLVSLVGIDTLVPRMVDLSVLLKLLARSATGQAMTIYTSLFGGPRSAGEKDGPEEYHLVLIDSGRTEILGSEYRETLGCIRCGACLNACPIYRKIDGHFDGGVRPGPIGAVLTPLWQGLSNFKELPQASSLCGACHEACPVNINIPRHLINLRRDIVSKGLCTWTERLAYRAWARGMKHSFWYKLMTHLQKFELRRRAGGSEWIRKLPLAASGWTQGRDMPAPAKRTFHQLWRDRPTPGQRG